MCIKKLCKSQVVSKSITILYSCMISKIACCSSSFGRPKNLNYTCKLLEPPPPPRQAKPLPWSSSESFPKSIAMNTTPTLINPRCNPAESVRVMTAELFTERSADHCLTDSGRPRQSSRDLPLPPRDWVVASCRVALCLFSIVTRT